MQNKQSTLATPLQNHLPRVAYDLGQKSIFSIPAGLITPFYACELNPGEKVKIGAEYLSRLRPLNTATFARMRQVVQYYFVPYAALYTYFPQMISRLRANDVFTSTQFTNNVGNQITTILPTFNPFQLVQDLSDAGYNDMHGIPILPTAMRYLDMLGYGSYGAFKEYVNNLDAEDPKSLPSRQYSAFRLAAFQKIYQDHFRQEAYEGHDPYSYNMDSLANHMRSIGAEPGSNYQALQMTEYPSKARTDILRDDLLSGFETANLVQPRYALYPRDYSTNIIPSGLYSIPTLIRGTLGNSPVIFGSTTSQVTVNRGGYNTVGVNTGNFSSQSNLATDPTYNAATARIASGYNATYGASGNSFSLASLRNAYAYERWAEVTRRAGKRYSDQMLAHFGFSAIDPMGAMDSIYIGGYSDRVEINQVLNTTSADNAAPLGDYGGQGAVNGMNGHKSFNFTAKQHGVIIGITYLLPIPDYRSNFVDPFCRKTTIDEYFLPEMDRLGYQLMLQSDVSFGTDNNYLSSVDVANSWVGWQPRYAEYKSKLDVAHLKYGDSDDISFQAYRIVKPDDQLFTERVVYGNDGTTIEAHYCYVTPRYFHVDPRCVNSIFVLQNESNDPSTDSLDMNIYTDCRVIRPMSRDGLPHTSLS